MKSICLLLALGTLPVSALTISFVHDISIPKEAATGRLPPGLSGITYAGGNRWYAIKDSGALLYPLEVELDLSSGAVTNCSLGTPVKLNPASGPSGRDFEDVAWDAALRLVWVSDECDASIRAFAPDSGAQSAAAAVPPVFRACRPNLSLEALAIRPNGLEMWTCNEEALCGTGGASSRGTDDGPCSTQSNGSVIRLQKFTRTSFDRPWTPSGQWAYETDSLGGCPFMNHSRSGVSGLCVLDDGTVLVLERELSVKMIVPSFRCRIYQIDLSGATDTSKLVSLKGATVRKAAKKCLFDADTGFAMYEGIGLGPVLADGARSVLLVSDGDGGALSCLGALKLTP